MPTSIVHTLYFGNFISNESTWKLLLCSILSKLLSHKIFYIQTINNIRFYSVCISLPWTIDCITATLYNHDVVVNGFVGFFRFRKTSFFHSMLELIFENVWCLNPLIINDVESRLLSIRSNKFRMCITSN